MKRHRKSIQVFLKWIPIFFYSVDITLLPLLEEIDSYYFVPNWNMAMVPHSSTLAWKVPWTEKPGGLQSMGLLSWTRLSDFTLFFHFCALEKKMATHSSILAWRIPGTGEPGGLLSMGSHRVGHDWSDLAYCPKMLLLWVSLQSGGQNVQAEPSTLVSISYFKVHACLKLGQSELFSGVLNFWIGETRFHVSFHLKIESQILNRAKIYSILLEKEMATHSSILA